MNTDPINDMIRIARQDLININKHSAKERLKGSIKKMAGRGGINKDMLFWPAGMLLLGLYEAMITLPKDNPLHGEILKDIRNYVDTWAEATNEHFSYVDDSLAGITILYLFAETGSDNYLKYAGKLYEFLTGYKKTGSGSILYNQDAGNDYVFADGAGQTAMFLCQFGAITRSSNAFMAGLLQLDEFYKNGFDKKSNLPYHAFSGEDHKKLGLLGWGRSLGWLLLGYSSCVMNAHAFEYDLKVIEAMEGINKQFLSLCETLLEYQREDGGFSWHIPAVEGAADTSATAMIAYSMALCLSSGAFKDNTEKYNTALLNAKKFLLSHTKDGSVEDSLSGCEDLCVHRQVYGHYPWGQGSALAFLSVCPVEI